MLSLQSRTALKTFCASFVPLWYRLITLSILALVFSEALYLAQGRAQGWSYYLTPSEVAFEVVVRLVVAALTGMALGTVCSLILAPVCWYFGRLRERIIEMATRISVFLVVFLVGRYALDVLIKWSYSWGTHPAIYDKLLVGLFFVGFAIAVSIPKTRREVVSSLDGFLTPKVTRRTAMTTVAGTAALVTGEYLLSKTGGVVASTVSSPRPESNILLITFDALTAEDMSLYGYNLPTTPHINEFARKSTVFTQFYAASTFTTPCIGVMLTGCYPSDTRVYGLSGQFPDEVADRSVAKILRDGGYRTAAILTNPWAYYLAQSLTPGFDLLPDPVFHPGGMQRLWEATAPLHQDSDVGSRIDEYFDLEKVWNSLYGLPNSLAFRYRPHATLRHAKQMLAVLPNGHFLWIHGMPPHHPYLPSPKEQGKFLPQQEVLSFSEEPWTHWKPHYPPDQQGAVDRRRLAYDEYICSTDRAFGDLMKDLENSGKLENTTIIVSADHGESFSGGVYQHQTPYLTRPVIHIPLIIRTPGQTNGRTVSAVADQTALAPTILELAGQKIPDWMRGRSLAAFLKNEELEDKKTLAFSQYLERNSTFKPVRKGSVGVIDGEYQYVVYLDSQRGELRPLSKAEYWNVDRSDTYPEEVKRLRAALQAQFPGLIQ